LRENRKNNAPRVALSLTLLLTVLTALLVAPSVRAGDAPKPAPVAPAPPTPPGPPAPPPEIPWDTIEAWAGGNAIPEGPKVADAGKKSDAKAPEKATAAPGPAAGKPDPATPPAPVTPPQEVKPAWIAPKPGEHRAEPSQCAEIRTLFLRHAELLADRAEKSREYERAFTWYYRMERYSNAFNELVNMRQDPKHFASKDYWIKEKWFETGCVMPQSPVSHQDLETLFNEWKTAKLARMKEAESKPDYNKDSKNWENWDISMREKMYTEKPTLMEFLLKREQSGEADPAILWELCTRYGSEHPAHPLRYMTVLYKLREWFPDYEKVKSGEVQWRIVTVLADQLDLHKEWADEAHAIQEKYPKYSAVTGGDALWYEAAGRKEQAEENRPKKEQIEIWRESKRLFVDFQQKFPASSHNHPAVGEKKSEAQQKIEDISSHLH
jgi:hypothetical protein